MNIQDKMQEIHHKYGVTEMANYKIQLFVDELIKTEKEQLRLHIVSQQREQLIDFSMKRNKAPKEFRPQYEKEVDEYLKSINCG